VSEELRRSPLHELHVESGAVLAPFAGWQLPLRFSSETTEHGAVRSAAGLFDLSHMGQIHVNGPGATAVLDQVVVSDIAAVAPGRAKYTVMCDDAGGVVEDLIVYRLGERQLLVIANAVNAGLVERALAEAAVGRDAQVSAASDALIAVQGPRAAEILAAVAGDPAALAAVRPYGCCRTLVAGVPAFVARTGYTGEDGFEVSVAASRAEPVWRALRAAGSGHGLVSAGLACRDTLRLEAGMALYGHELTREVDPFQAGLGRVVAFGKAANFTGRAALEGLRDRPPGRVRSGVVATGRRILRAGQSLSGGQTPGEVTSGAWSPTLQRSIALAYLPVEIADPGTRLVATVRGSDVEAEVTPIPFYRRPRPQSGAAT